MRAIASVGLVDQRLDNDRPQIDRQRESRPVQRQVTFERNPVERILSACSQFCKPVIPQSTSCNQCRPEATNFDR